MAIVAEAHLTAAERKVLDRFVGELRERLGEELVAVWLYGSRARGERTGPGSDVDLLVVVESRSRERDDGISTLLRSIAEDEGASPYFFFAHTVDRAWLADRRAIRAFFIQNVDHDKLVLFGESDGLAGEEIEPERAQPGEVSRRSKEYLDQAHEELRAARALIGRGPTSLAVGHAYYAMFNAAKAALSETDRHSRTHSGTWGLFGAAFVTTGRFDPELHALASGDAQEARHASTYRATSFTEDQARELAEGAERFVAAVEAMLDADPE